MSTLPEKVKFIVRTTGMYEFKSEWKIGEALHALGAEYDDLYYHFGAGSEILMGYLDAQHEEFLLSRHGDLRFLAEA